jgi:magnesium-transporting ATPase (P-type)
VTIALSLGARAMAARGAIVKRLSAVETLGSATIVASDKTGTLTENTLRVVAVLPAEGRTSVDVLSVAALASSAELVHEDGGLRILGDPVEGALLVAAGEQGIARPELLAARKLLREVPFDSARRSSSALYDEAGRTRAVTKGAPEVILTTRPNGNGALLIQSAEEWAGEGLRVLAVAERMLEAGGDLDEGKLDFSPVGLVALDDPLRPGAADAIARARTAGLGVKILTGDHPATANAIAAALGVDPSDVHARVTPADKLRLVKELQAGGDVVVVTGDGVNDSPALRQADVGIAMGRSGTEAAREAADLVLTDDDFATIVAAVREGRAIADNVRKFVAFLLSANFGEVLLFAVTVLGGLGVPMTVAQVLVVNVLTDGLPAAALSRDPPSPETMTHGPQRSNRLFSPGLWSALGLVGTIVGAAGLGAYLAGRALGGGQAQTMAFATIALAELLLVFSCRSVRTPAWREPANGYLVLGVLLSAALLGLGVYLPILHAPLGTVALGGAAFGIVCGLAALPFVATECAKGIARRMVG